MKYLEFKEKYLGQVVNYDGKYGYQCVDLVRQYIKECFENKQPPLIEGAKDLWKVEWPDGYKKLENTTQFIPRKGDIVVFDAYGKNKYGHVGIVDEANMYYVRVLEQNAGSGNGDGKNDNKIKVGLYNYTQPKVLGFIRWRTTKDYILSKLKEIEELVGDLSED